MTLQRADEIERAVFYRHLNSLALEMKDCENKRVAFNVGRYLGIMQLELHNQLAEEVDEEE